jgi:hypothetical protein
MITLGLDPDPASHTVVALDESGVSLGHLTVSNTAEGLTRLCEFSAQLTPGRWAVEGLAITSFACSSSSCFAVVSPFSRSPPL